MDSFEQYEKDCKRLREQNRNILNDFEIWLTRKNLSTKTIKKHCSNVDFYINDYLLYEEAIEAAHGTENIGNYLGYWLIRKAMWASQTAIKENASSLKKFYQFMFEKKKISKDSLDWMTQRIKDEMPDWLATMGRYDDPDIEDMEEVWGI